MDTLTNRLKQQAEGLDTTGLAPPAEHLPSVVRRGKRYLVAMSAATILGSTAAVAAAAVVLPQVVEELRGPETPVVLSTPEDEPVPEATIESEQADEPNDDVEEPAPLPAVPDDEPVATTVDTVAPDLAVLSPADGSTVTAKELMFRGEVEPGATVMAGPYEATVADDGVWSIVLIADRGDNDVTFTATDAAGNATTKTVTVTYKPPTTEKSEDKAATGTTLTANQKTSELPSAPHTNLYWGTAAPEAKVAVTSAHGTAYTWANAAGDWQVEVDFNPPAGTTTFPVTVQLYHQPEVATTFSLTTVAADAQTFTANQQQARLDSGPYTNVYWGTADPGEKIKVLSDHGWASTWANEAGDWQVEVDFDPPAGTKEFDVTARYYHDSGVARTFRLTTVAPAAAEFTASQQKASVLASAPTNTYSGTGEPGHDVLIWTEAHGQVTTQVAGDGTWQVQLTYSDVVPGDTFKVKAADLDGGTRHYFQVTITS